MQTEFIDRVLTCADCRGQFIFTAGEQIFFLDKQFKNDPKRCKPCKAKRLAPTGGISKMVANSRTETRTECSECHVETTVPFKPTQGRPVLCRQCFQGRRSSMAGAANSTTANPVTSFHLASVAETLPEPLSEPLVQPVA